MPSSRKRGRVEMEDITSAPTSVTQEEPTVLDSLRNMWEFANLAQFIFLFGRVFKIDENIGIEELEMACQDPQSTLLQEIGLALLKFVSSHRGLTPEIFDEYTRRQYLAKAPARNPFGEDSVTRPFIEFSAMEKIRVLQQLTQWTMYNPDRFREKIHEIEGVDKDQAYWRVEPFGWDSQDRTYIVLDDNRLYRQTDPEPPAPPKLPSKPKKGSKKAKAAARASKRRKLMDAASEADDSVLEEDNDTNAAPEVIDNGLGGAKWECLAISLDQFNDYLSSIEKSKDVNEKDLRQRIISDVLPLLEKQEEARKRKQLQKERELLNIQKLATAKRSGRLAGKAEQRRQEEDAREAQRKAEADMMMAKKEQERWLKLEKERESRMQTREQRLKEREARRILHEAELASLSEDSKNVDTDGLAGRIAERHLKAEMQKKKAALEELQLDEDWVFDCICGVYGQVDDGTLSIACEKCNVWQHTKCVGVSDADANSDTFEFVCQTCINREKEAEAARKKESQERLERERRKIEMENEMKNRQPSGYKIKLHSKPSSGSFNPGVIEIPLNGTTRRDSSDLPVSSSNLPPVKSSPAQVRHTSNGAAPPMSVWQPHPSSANSSPRKPSQSPSTKNAFQPPAARSPTSLPPPQPSRSYATVDQSSSVGGLEGLQSPAEAYYRHQTSHATPNHERAPAITGSQHASTANRRVSTNFPSPLVDAPILKPASPYNGLSGESGSVNGHKTEHKLQIDSQQLTSVPSFATPTSQRFHEADPAHLAALPDASTGISPTKSSPPRPAIATATPHTMPSIPALSPSPQHQNLTPPVKSSTGHRSSLNGHQITHGPSSPVENNRSGASRQSGIYNATPISSSLAEPVILAAPESGIECMSSPVKSQSPVAASPTVQLKPLNLNGSSS